MEYSLDIVTMAPLSKHLPDHAEQLADVALALRQLHTVREPDTHVADAEGLLRAAAVNDKRDEPARQLALVGLLEDALSFWSLREYCMNFS